MILKTASFRENEKLISTFTGNEDRRNSSIYLNFDTSKAYLFNMKYNARLPFEFTGDKLDSFYVEIPAFLLLCSRYDELEVKKVQDKLVFVGDGKTFQINTFSDDFDEEVFDYSKHTKYQFTSKTLEALKLAKNFYGPDDYDNSLHGVLLKEKHIVASDRLRLFHAIHDVDLPEVQMSGYPLELAISAGATSPISFYHTDDESESLYFVVGDGDFEIVFKNTTNLFVPDTTNEDFKAKFDHEESFTFDRQVLERELKFFEIFVKDVRNERLYVTVKSETELLIEAKDEKLGEQTIVISDTHKDLVGQSFWIMRNHVLQSLQVIGGTKCKIQFNSEAPAFNISGVDVTDKHIVLVRLV